MKYKFILVLPLITLLAAFVLHPVNMTVGDITYKEKKIHLKFKLFADDFQSALSDYYKSNINLIGKDIDATTRKRIHDYIQSKFSMSVNGVPLKWTYRKAYLTGEVFFIEYECPYGDVTTIKSVVVKDIIQFESFPEQKNIVNINFSGQMKVLEFANGEEESGEATF